MSRPFAIYPDAFDPGAPGLGYWRFGEGGGRLTCVAGGPTMVNNGAEAEQGGYRFVRANGDYMETALSGQPERSTLTLETWVRDWGIPNPPSGATTGYITALRRDSDPYNTRIGIQGTVHADPALSYISAWWRVGGVTVGVALWQGLVVNTLLFRPEPWHVALVMDDLNTFRLFVNGVQRAQDTTGLIAAPADDYTLRLGQIFGSMWGGPNGVLDEARLSKVARYAGGTNGTRYFWPVRFGEGRRALARGPGTRAGLFAGVVG